VALMVSLVDSPSVRVGTAAVVVVYSVVAAWSVVPFRGVVVPFPQGPCLAADLVAVPSVVADLVVADLAAEPDPCPDYHPSAASDPASAASVGVVVGSAG
jgi:hypothetical protein